MRILPEWVLAEGIMLYVSFGGISEHYSLIRVSSKGLLSPVVSLLGNGVRLDLTVRLMEFIRFHMTVR